MSEMEKTGMKATNSESEMEKTSDRSNASLSDLPQWVVTLCSEAVLCFVFPLLFWSLASVGLYFSIGWGKEFRVITSLLWGGVTLLSLTSFLALLFATSSISNFVDVPPINSSFTAYYAHASKFYGRKRGVVLLLGATKALVLACGFAAIVGGVWTISLWLSSGIFLKAGV